MTVGSSWRVCGFVLLLVVLNIASQTIAWSNGGYSSNPSNPDYGTHDWIAQHALEFLPLRETTYIRDNIATYLYGTELPDNNQAPDGIGDRYLHHVYYYADRSLQDNAAAVRAQEEFDTAVTYLETSNYYMAAKTVGIMSGYLTDLSVFGHVMGSGSDWGAEIHHSDYENYVRDMTTSYTSSVFDSYLSYDGTLDYIDAYDATLSVAYDTTFGKGEIKDCVWMDNNYDWSDPLFKNSAGASLNGVVNALADVLHALAIDADYPGPDTVPPSVTITSPKDGETLTSRTVTVMGAASDNQQVQKVQISIDETNWVDCIGTTSWSGTLTLPPGSSRIYAKVTDAAGNWKIENVRVTVEIPVDEAAASFDWLPIAIIIVVAIVGSLTVGLWLLRRKKRK